MQTSAVHFTAGLIFFLLKPILTPVYFGLHFLYQSRFLVNTHGIYALSLIFDYVLGSGLID
jgi:hypothetical protein